MYLMLLSRNKERIRESGIMLSLGFSKSRIMIQYAAEVLLIAVLAFGLALPASSVIGQAVGETLLERELNEQDKNLQEELYGGSGMTSISSEDVNPSFNAQEQLTNIDVAVTPFSFLLTCVVAILLIIGSVLAAGVSFIRQTPREILSQLY